MQFRTALTVAAVVLGGTFHKNYNGWIQSLQRGINARLSAS